jgi:hypothetical protein
MKTQIRHMTGLWSLALLFVSAVAGAQVPVDEDGQPVGDYEPNAVAGDEELAVLNASELEELVGPIALYPDDLLAIVLPASTYPLQIVEAARFVEDLKEDESLEPDEDWDDSIVALTNYPEVLEMMNEDLDWTWRLGEAVAAQQTDVIQAIEAFRDRAYAAGNLKSDDFQVVTDDDGVIEISPAKEDVIYVPYYEPERVVVYQPRPVYFYYPRAYPVYYYPYPSGYYFDVGYFWGVTTAFSIGWHTHHLHTWHHSYFGHPYYGHYYYPRYWYRRPDIHVYNRYYVYDRYNYRRDRYRRGDYWQPHNRRTVRAHDQRITRTRHYPGTSSTTTTSARRPAATTGTERRPATTSTSARNRAGSRRNNDNEIRFRKRSDQIAPATTLSGQQRRANSTQRRGTTSSRQRVQTSPERKPDLARAFKQRSARSPNSTVKPRESLARSAAQPRRSAPRSTVQRRQSAPRPTVQRRESAPRPTVQRRQSAPRPTVQRRAPAPRPQKSASVSRQRSAPASSPSRERSSKPSSRKSSFARSDSRRR